MRFCRAACSTSAARWSSNWSSKRERSGLEHAVVLEVRVRRESPVGSTPAGLFFSFTARRCRWSARKAQTAAHRHPGSRTASRWNQASRSGAHGSPPARSRVAPASRVGGANGGGGIDAPICQDTRSGGLDDLLASAEIGHDALVDLASEETFQAPDDLSLGSAVRRAACDVINGRLMAPPQSSPTRGQRESWPRPE